MFFTSCIGLEGKLYLLLADFRCQRVARDNMFPLIQLPKKRKEWEVINLETGRTAFMFPLIQLPKKRKAGKKPDLQVPEKECFH